MHKPRTSDHFKDEPSFLPRFDSWARAGGSSQPGGGLALSRDECHDRQSAAESGQGLCSTQGEQPRQRGTACCQCLEALCRVTAKGRSRDLLRAIYILTATTVP